jgi:pimeloyl-ACP methyl ester carboxylesterase
MRALKEVELAPGILADLDDDGSGAWVLFFHSRYANKSLWSEVASAIPSGSVCAFNQRGFNPGDESPPPVERSLESVTAVFDALRPKRAVLVGTSTGAGLALAACTDDRLPIVGAVLAGFLVPSSGNSSVADRFGVGSVTERTFAARFASERPGAVERFNELSQQVPRAAREFSVVDFWKYLVQFPYQNIRVPLLFVTGADDLLMAPHIVRESLRRLPTAQSRVVPDVGHGIISQAPLEFREYLQQFLDDIGFPNAPAD